MPISTSSIAHVRLTVTDIERSRQFYESVFGWPVLIESPESADAATQEALGFLFGGVVYDLGRIASKDELDAAAAHLDELGVEHEPIKDIGPSYILEFRDPDNIALELTAPK